MPNRNLFKTGVQTQVKPTNTVNLAGGKAYKTSDEHALAQYVVTGCFNRTFYATAEDQVDKIKELTGNCRSEFIAKAAVYGHEVAGMKDTPAYLLAVLAARIKAGDVEAGRLFERIFPRVVTNGKMLMNFVQIIRSGAAGRRSFGTAAKRAIRKWLESKTGNQIFTGSIGANPSFGDIIKMTHPKPETPEKKALYAYLIDRPYEAESLPPKVAQFEAFKQGKQAGVKMPVPDVPFQMLTALNLTPDEWVGIARNLPWNALRMNLNTLARHGVFNVKGMTEYVAEAIANPELVRKFNVFPYQLLAAYLNTEDIPSQIRNALQDAMEIATENVPEFGVPTAVCIDTSGSMSHSVTGYRTGSTSKVRCVDVAALAGATIARKNKNTTILPFDTRVHDARSVNPRDSIVTNAQKLSRFGGGGTDVASAMRVLNGLVGGRPEVIIYISDNESWFNGKYSYGYYRGTGMAQEWAEYRRKTKNAKLVCIDLTPNQTVQVEDQDGVLNIGGFSDKVWPAIKSFIETNNSSFIKIVEDVEL